MASKQPLRPAEHRSATRELPPTYPQAAAHCPGGQPAEITRQRAHLRRRQRDPLRGVFRSSARDVLKCYLHAGALDERNIRSVLEWSRRLDNPTQADILRRHEEAARGWAAIIAVHTS
jgi:hypothetical protein